MIDKGTYEVYQAVAHLIVNREYKPGEFELFGKVSKFLGGEMKAYEDSIDSDDLGAEVPSPEQEDK